MFNVIINVSTFSKIKQNPLYLCLHLLKLQFERVPDNKLNQLNKLIIKLSK